MGPVPDYHGSVYVQQLGSRFTGLAPSGRNRITSRSQGSSAALVTVTAPVVGSCFLSQRFLGRVGGDLVKVFDVGQVVL